MNAELRKRTESRITPRLPTPQRLMVPLKEFVEVGGAGLMGTRVGLV